MTDDQRQSRPNYDRQAQTAPLDLGKHVTTMLNVVTKVLSAELDACDLTPLEYSLLRLCLERGECTATEIAQELPVDASRISRMVTRLVDNGLLLRRRLTDDRRVVKLRLSDSGHETTSLLFNRIQGYYARLTSGINEADIKVFEAVSLKVIDNYLGMEPSLER